MTALGIMNYTMPQSQAMMQSMQSINNINKAVNSNSKIKINVISNININNNNSNTINLISNSENRNYVIVRKKQRILPLSSSNSNIMAVATATESNLTHKKSVGAVPTAALTNVVHSKATVKNTMPVSVARRNARERNRVKEVNNGFAALRERIPKEVAESFETQGNVRCLSAKKLSKVETLRMAVEYIRSLEMVLASADDPNRSSPYSTAPTEDFNSSMISTASSPTSPPMQAEFSMKSEPEMDTFDEDNIMIDPTLSEIRIIDGHQYVRLAGTNTYQLIGPFYENDENIAPLQPITTILQPTSNYSLQIVNTSLATQAYVQQAPLNVMTPASVSPSAFSGQSISPALLETNTEQCYVNLQHSPQNDGTTLFLANTDDQTYDAAITLKTEMQDDDLLLDHQPISAESMMDAIEWWDKTRIDEQDVS